MLRHFVAGAALLFAGAAGHADETASLTSLPTPWMASDGAVIDFTVLRKGKPFGTHVLSFSRDSEGRLSVTTEVDLQVKFGPITAFKYQLDSVEQWIDGKLVSLSGNSNNDGRKGAVEAETRNGQLVVDSTKFDGILPSTIIPSSHWNRLQVYQTQMLSTETGEVLDIDVEVIGEDQVRVGDEVVDATHYRLKSDLTVDLWYDRQSRWVKLVFEVRGQEIEYALNALY